MNMRLVSLLLLFSFCFALGCSNGTYDPKKGDALVAATTNPAITIGVPAIATAAGGPGAGAGALAIVTAVGAIAAAVVSVLNNKHATDTKSTVGTVALDVAQIATAVAQTQAKAAVEAPKT
jgi:hypothetical protein